MKYLILLFLLKGCWVDADPVPVPPSLAIKTGQSFQIFIYDYRGHEPVTAFKAKGDTTIVLPRAEYTYTACTNDGRFQSGRFVHGRKTTLILTYPEVGACPPQL